jgi:hypothetical protein
MLPCFITILYNQKRKKQDTDKNDIIAKVCNHNDTHEFERNDISSYFTQGYYDNNPHAPKNCFRCGPEKLLGIDIKVNGTNPVHCCINCKNNDQPCNYALCNTCFTDMSNEEQASGQNNKRIRKKKEINRFIY